VKRLFAIYLTFIVAGLILYLVVGLLAL